MVYALDDYRWLIGSEAERWLAELAGASGEPEDQAALLRKDLSATRVHLLVEQTALRRRARQKFAAADQMFFTRLGLEQATDDMVAAYKAGRFASQEMVCDLCCGIGGDLMAISSRGPAEGIERDAVTALLAEANCRVVADGSGIATKVQVQDVADLDLAGAQPAWSITIPACRRSSGCSPLVAWRPSSWPRPLSRPRTGKPRRSSNGSAKAASADNWSPGSARWRGRPAADERPSSPGRANLGRCLATAERRCRSPTGWAVTWPNPTRLCWPPV